eukprot:jgi/Ulvmu1/9110/UM005_0205.1
MKSPFSRGRGSGKRVNHVAAHATGSAIPWQAAGAVVAVGVLSQILKPQPAKASAPSRVEPVQVPKGCEEVDVVLSSGFLSFANHAGFLRAVEEHGFRVGGIMGTSAGALSGSLYAAGYTPEQVALELSRLPPVEYLQLSAKPWDGGVLNMDKVIQRYRELLPPTFEDLSTKFAVGVYTREGEYRVIDSGPLPEAVVASAAIPFLFEHVPVPGVGHCMDGGKFDRVGLEGWQALGEARGRGRRDVTLVHLISRSSPFSGREEVAHGSDAGVVVLRSPKSGVSLTSLGDFDQHYNAAYRRSCSALEEGLRR